MNSSRLPGKALEDINGLSCLGWVYRAASAIQGVHQVIVATSSELDDEPILSWCKNNHVKCFRGSKNDVLKRLYEAAKSEKADVILRLTADCPLLDPNLCDQLLLHFELTGVDYATNSHPPTWPDGLDCEVFTMSALSKANKHSTLPSEREHVTRWIRSNKHMFSQSVLTSPTPGLHKYRWTVDTPEDLEFIRSLAQQLPNNRPCSYYEILNTLRTNTTVSQNSSVNERNSSLKLALSKDFKSKVKKRPKYTYSDKIFTKASKVIPTGSQTFSKSNLIFNAKSSPMFITHGMGARVWDVDGNEYVDLIAALLPVVLGHCDPDVDYAIKNQLSFGISHSLSTALELELAELLLKFYPTAEMVRFAKNGTDVTSAAIRIARAFTGKQKLAVGGYHGWQDWFIGSTNRNKGVPDVISALSVKFDPANPESLRRILKKHPKEFAAIIFEPIANYAQTKEKLEEIKQIANEYGCVLIFDEICTGFRVSMGGAQQIYGVEPDLTCLGKALGNGMPISALVGKEKIMSEFENVFVSGTFAGETLSLAAAIATITKLNKEDGINKIHASGESLRKKIRLTITGNNLDRYIKLDGPASWQFINLHDHENASALEIRTFLMNRLFSTGTLAVGSHNVSLAFSAANEEIVCLSYEYALAELTKALDEGPLIRKLGNQLVTPVFSVRNK